MHAVYVIRDDSGLVVYIGCTGEPDKREQSHRRSGALAADGEIEIIAQFANRRHAYEYENRLIGEKRPKFNRQGNPDFIAASWQQRLAWPTLEAVAA